VPVYVDALVVWGGSSAPRCFRNQPSCHLYADSVEELHAFARELGLRRGWFQDHRLLPHYDLTAGRRKRALQLGAKAHTRAQAVAKWKELRAGVALTPDQIMVRKRRAGKKSSAAGNQPRPSAVTRLYKPRTY
jgi:hypothetical protein